MATATCTHEGTEIRLKCATCEAAICPKCLVETKVGFKCPTHGRVVAAPGAPRPAAKRTDGQAGGKAGGRTRGRGMSIWALVAIVVLFPVLGFGMMALFAATADSTGFVALLPLIAVGAVLIGGTVFLASKLTR